MKQRIGETAGRIWEALQENGEMAISRVPKAVNERDVLTYLALGWLAREGNVGFRVDGKKTLVRLINVE